MAQAPQGPGGGQQGRQGRMMGPGGMMGDMMFGMRPPTAAEVPMPVLQRELALSNAQVATVQGIHTTLRESRRGLMPRRDPGAGPPDAAAMRTAMERMRALNDEAGKQIEGALTPEQKKTLAALLKTMDDYRMAGLPYEAAPVLRLSTEQTKQLAAIAVKARRAIKPISDRMQAGGGDMRANWQEMGAAMRPIREETMGLLTAEQRAALQRFNEERMQRMRDQRGPGGPGGAPAGV
ncbi:MAG TPA: Spy/CpxP family protein refolding chaperone [Chthonomonadales bacterium]|nr:Spy/CpxP family protein refolding chaperone [Chthonomonadales bacterium]